jgi:hypothetical protein
MNAQDSALVAKSFRGIGMLMDVFLVSGSANDVDHMRSANGF